MTSGHHRVGLSAPRGLKVGKAARNSPDAYQDDQQPEKELSRVSHFTPLIIAVSVSEVLDMISYISMFRSCPIRSTADFR